MTQTQADCVVIRHDCDPDMSWLEQDCYNPASKEYRPLYHDSDMKQAIDGDWYRDPDNHVALTMVAAYDEDGNVVDSLGGIDFLADSADWKTGHFGSLAALKDTPYLQELAKEMGLS